MANIPDWLKSYYKRIANDKNFDLERKDKFTNWALISLLGILAIFFQYLNSEIFNPIFCVGILAISISIIFRFFAHSCICYASIQNYNHLIFEIEDAFIKNNLDLNRFKWELENYGGRKGCISEKMLIRSVSRQLIAGFGIIFSICLILFIIDFIYSIMFIINLGILNQQALFSSHLIMLVIITVLFLIYIGFEIYLLKAYNLFKHIVYTEKVKAKS
jgi:hypothetical protein